MNNLQDQGRACYKRGEYKKAIEFFDRAIGRAASVQLLDNRAACYEKLEELQPALKDAKQAIQLHREDATGYLRAGRILVKMEKDRVALEIYTHGLRTIKHVGKGHEFLRSAHKELMDKLCPPKSVDPLTMLPRELAEIILEHLSFKQRMNACLVSKEWACFIRSCPDLWRHCDLSQANRKVKTAFISRAINVCKNKLTAATLNNLYDFDKTLAALVKHCPLQELTLLETGLLGSNLTKLLGPAKHLRLLTMNPSRPFPGDELVRLLTPLSEQLQALDCTVVGNGSGLWKLVFPQLRSLKYEILRQNNSAGFFADIADRMPSLQSLTFRKENSFPHGHVRLENSVHLRCLDLRIGLHSANTLKLPPTLTSLTLAQVAGVRSSRLWWTAGPNGDEPIHFDLPHLEELYLDMPVMSLSDIWSVLAPSSSIERNQMAPSKVRKLSIIGATLDVLMDDFLSRAALKVLTDFNLRRLDGLRDQDVKTIMIHLPSLRSLNLSETDISGVGVKYAVDSGRLEDLVVQDCPNLSLDAVEWARAKGVRVRHRSADTVTGGKKVRY